MGGNRQRKNIYFFIAAKCNWHNNKPVVARDINYNIKNVTFTVLDDTTIKATLDNPYSPFPSVVSKPLFQAGLVGFGNYRVSSIRLHGDTVSFIRLIPANSANPKDASSKEYHFYPTQNAAVLAYKLGEIDVLDELTSAYSLDSWADTRVQELTNYNHIVSLFFNVRNSVLQDKAVRQALAYGVPTLPGEPAFSPIPKTSLAYSDKIIKYTYDPAAMKKLFSSSKVATESAVISIATFPQYADDAQTVAYSWSSLGVPTEVKIVGGIPPDYQVLLSVQEVPPDPDQYPFWHSTQETTNKTGLTNVKIDKLLEDGRQELDQTARKKIYADFQRYLVEEGPAVFLHYQTVYSVRRK